MTRWFSAFGLACVCLLGTGCGASLSGVAREGQTLYAVSLRPASLLSCETSGGRLHCVPRPFLAPSRLESAMNGLAIVDSRLFYSGVTNGAQHDARQVLENFTLDKEGRVRPGPCAPLLVPLFADDERRAQGLSSLAYDAERKIIYLAKRSNKARLFALQLDAQSCPTGNFIALSVPKALPDYAAIAYSSKRQALYILSAKRPELIEWSLKSDTTRRSLADWPKAQKRIGTLSPPLSLLLDDTSDTLSIVDRQGRVLLIAL